MFRSSWACHRLYWTLRDRSETKAMNYLQNTKDIDSIRRNWPCIPKRAQNASTSSILAHGVSNFIPNPANHEKKQVVNHDMNNVQEF